MRDTFPFLIRLGLETSADAKDIRRAYARELKKIDQSADPAGFQDLREAYEIALRWHAHQQFAQAEHTQEAEVPEIAQPDAAREIDPVSEVASEPAHDNPYELADQAFVRFMSSVEVLAQSYESRHQSRWKAALEASLNEDTLLNLTARTIFEARIVHLLASGWKPGHETLFVAACDVFNWTHDSRRILQFGESGAMLDRAIDEWKLYESMPANGMGTIKQLIQFVRTTPQPEGVAGRSDLMLFQQLAGRFYNWFTVIVDRDSLQNWSNAAQAEVQRAGPEPVTPLEYIEPPAPQEKKSGFSGWQIAFLIFMVIKALGGIMNSNSSPPAYSPPPLKLEKTIPQPPVTQDIYLPAPSEGSPTEEQLRAVERQIFYVADPAKVLGVLKVSFEVELDNQGRVCPFAGRIDPVELTLSPGPGERRDPVVRPFEPQFL